MSKDIYSNVLQEPRVANDQVMSIGEFGFGGLAVDLPSDDCDSVAASGIYKTKATTANCPDDITDTTDSVVFAMPIDNQIQQQMFFDKSGGVYSRTEDAGTWSEWRIFSFEGDAISYGNISVTNRVTFTKDSESGYLEQVDLADENILRLSATDQDLDTTIELYGDASSTQVKVIVIKAGGTEVTIDSDGIKSNKMGASEKDLIQKAYVDGVDILPFRDAFYDDGAHLLPGDWIWTDFREVHLFVYPYPGSADLASDIAIAPAEYIAEFPDSFTLKFYYWADPNVGNEIIYASKITATSPTAFTISNQASKVMMVIGYPEKTALHKLGT